MKAYKKMLVLISISAFMILGMSATKPPQEKEKFTNLKVLPKNTDDDEIERIMFTFKKQLGVKCLYCHVLKKNAFPEEFDFASDEKTEKKITREMMKMTIKLNKKFFGAEKDIDAFRKPKLSCNTCHHGSPRPSGMDK